MKIFSYLECKDQELISRDIYNYLSVHTSILINKLPWSILPTLEILNYVPELNKFLLSLNLIATSISVLQYFESRKIHVDTIIPPRINFPVRNTTGTAKTYFYECENIVHTPTVNESGVPCQRMTYSSIKELGFFELTKPVVFNPGIPHRVIIDGKLDEPRIALTIFFKDPPYCLLN